MKISGSKHFGAILNVLIKQFYVCALVGVLIECLYEMHGAAIERVTFVLPHLHTYHKPY